MTVRELINRLYEEMRKHGATDAPVHLGNSMPVTNCWWDDQRKVIVLDQPRVS